MATGLQRFVFTFLLPFFLFSQSDKISFEHITVEDGLSTGFIKHIIQDSRGYIWIGTDLGINRYDGYNFIIYKNEPENPNSLNSNSITKIYEDSRGIIWVGTQTGLNRYDRNLDQFYRYNNISKDSNSIGNKQVQSFYEDSDGVLWIGTAKGLKTYNRKEDNFSQTSFPQLSKKDILSIKEDLNKNLWIGTFFKGLYKLDSTRAKIKHYSGKMQLLPRRQIDDCSNLSNPSIRTIFETTSGQLWFGTHLGLNKYNQEKDCFENHFFDKNEWIKNLIVQITEDPSGDLWVGAWNGLYKVFNKYQDHPPFFFKEIKPNNTNNSANLSSNKVYTLLLDKSDVLWIGTYGDGINKYSHKKNKFITYQNNFDDAASLSGNHVTCFTSNFSLSPKTIWIGTTHGLNKFNRANGTFTRFRHDPDNPYSISNNHINTICIDTLNGNPILWIGTDSGVNKFDIRAGKFYSKKHLPFPYTLRDEGIWKIVRDKNGNLLFGTVNGLFRYDQSSAEQKVQYYSIKDTLSAGGYSSNISKLFFGKKDHLWIVTPESFIDLDLKKNIFQRFSNDADLNLGSNITSANYLYEDLVGNTWISTDNGLFKFDWTEKKYRQYTKKDGLSSNVVNGILAADNATLWLSTNHGLSLFNPLSETFKNYDVFDGLQSKEFFSEYKCPLTGEMFFGGAKGFNVFHPDSIEHNSYVPSIVITDIKIHNQSVPIAGKAVNADSIISQSPLQKHISESDNIQLAFNQNYLTFEFAALDYNAPQKNKYAYKMDDVDKDWVYTDASRRFATYTQLNPGEYTFRVKGSNNDGLWNEEGTSLRIIITPPWWRTNLAYVFYLLFVLLVIFTAWRLQVNRLNVIHKMEMEHLHAEKLQEIDQMKSHFFANISHEFRTPLTLIKGPVKQLLSGDFIGNIKQQYKMILRNTNRLLALINQLLDLSKLDSGKMKLQAEALDVVFLLRGLVQSFESLAKQKQIELLFETTTKYLTAYLDRDKFEKIINNLLSNAFKFTAQWGKIRVAVCTDNKGIHADFSVDEDGKLLSSFAKNREHKLFRIVITDSGRGIAQNQIDSIFDRFQQADNAYKNDTEGTGIGLALTKELVELHQGKIDVESKKDSGTSFTVSLPLGRNHLNDDQIIDTIATAHKPEILIPEESLKVAEEGLSGLSTMAGRERPLVLIVEDNPDVRSYLHSNLYAAYRIIEAANGASGFERAVHSSPDLLISDVMMPKMDGFELCRKIKSDERTSHIPLILLTARAAHEDKMAGLQTGADDYIAKPFDVHELLIRSKNLIEQRRLLRQKFAAQNIFNAREIATTPTDLSFLERAKKIIENNIGNAAYNVEHFAEDICLSRSQLHRKIKALTNYPASRFIRILRLQHAYNLLSKDKTIAEVAYEVGFNNPAYFSDCFRQQFGKLPSEHLNSV